MINENLKNIIYNLMYAKDEKDLTIQLARELNKRLINQDLTLEQYQELKKVGKIISKYL
jgi:serine protease inhibitor